MPTISTCVRTCNLKFSWVDLSSFKKKAGHIISTYDLFIK